MHTKLHRFELVEIGRRTKREKMEKKIARRIEKGG